MPHSGRAQVQPVPAPPTSTPAKPQDQASRHNRIPSTEGTVASSLEDEQTPEDPQQQEYPQSTATAPLTTIDRPAALQSGVATAAQSPTSPNVAAMVQPDVSNGTLRSSEPSPPPPQPRIKNGLSWEKPKKSRPRNRRSNSDIPPSVAQRGGDGAPSVAFNIPPYHPAYPGTPPRRQGFYPPTAGTPPAPPPPYPYNVTPPYLPQQQLQQPMVYTPQQQYPPPASLRGDSMGKYQDAYTPQQQEPQSLRDPRRQAMRSSGHKQSRSGGGSSRRHRRDHHRRSKSSSAAVPGVYGAFWEPPPPPPQQPPLDDDDDDDDLEQASPTVGSNKFSPRDEFRKLAQGLSPKQQQQQPTTRSARHQRSYSYNVPPPPPPAPFLQHTSSRGFGDASAYYYDQQHHQQSPLTTLSSPGRFVQSQRKSESARKMQMRQHSAQLFMEDTKGVEQELKCRNVFFLLVFVFHLVFMGYLGQLFGHEALQFHEDREDAVTIYYHNFIYISCLAGAFATIVSALLLGAMMLFARQFVQIALIVVITFSFVWGTVGIGVSPKTVVPVTGIIALGLAVAYTLIVWDRIPFAAANLLTALSGIRAFPGTILVALGFQLLTLAYSITFSIVVVGVYDEIQEHRKMEIPPRLAYVIYVLLGISFCWTYQVLENTVQVITAGVIYGWWLTPTEENVVGKACFTTLFYSMGSICFGSLFVGPVRILRQFASPFRPSSAESSSLECIHECIFCVQACVTSCIETIAAGCNAWAFTYIGMYHYAFLDAGYNATELFERRGWSTIVSDDLVPNVLFLTSVVIGGATGLFTHLMSRLDSLTVSPEGQGVVPFFEGVVLGLALTGVLFSSISSAVNAVLVCFASSPVDFERNHSDLSHEMRSAWREVWPGALDVCDASLAMAHASPAAFHQSIRFSERSPLL